MKILQLVRLILFKIVLIGIRECSEKFILFRIRKFFILEILGNFRIDEPF